MARFGDLTRVRLREVAAEALLVIPLGATEQHGPHLPVATDTLLLQAVADRVMQRLEGTIPVLLAPVLAFGSSDYHLPFGGTLSLRTETYLRILMELGRSAADSGFCRLFFLNGHGGNHELAQLAARDLAHERTLTAGAGSWWMMAQAALLEVAAGRIANVPGHAGGFETSAVLAVAPDLVVDAPERLEAVSELDLPVDYRVEIAGWWQAMQGYTDNPVTGSATLGARFLEAAVAKVAADLIAFYEAVR